MDQAELLEWVEFYKLFPFDDLHRFHRPAALVATAGAAPKDRMKAVAASVDWLQPEPTLTGLSSVDVDMMRLMGFNRKGT